MKKKTVSLCLVLALLVTAAIGGTMAYFTDTDYEDNVFTTGNVEIDLEENFGDNDPTTPEKLLPGIDVTKEVTVTNTGSETAYVRVHVAFPEILDSGSPELLAYKNTLHWNFSEAAVQEGQWSQLQNKDQVGPNKRFPNWPGNGSTEYNTYKTVVNGITYNVYVITYETALEPNEKTATPAISNVYLDTSVTNEKMTEILSNLIAKDANGRVISEGIKVLVFAEGGQAAGFEDAYTALNTQFKNPMSEGYVSPWNQK